jgi:hypothetical protein
MSDTPETDAICKNMNTGNYQSSLWFVAERMRDHAKQMERERDEAREKYDNLAAEHMLVVNKLCNERDEAIEKHRFAVIHWQIGVAKMERERDDALNQITGWENKWKAAVEMAAIAENKVSNLEDQVDLAMKVIKRLEANKP